jgi:hypothetical protein
MPNDAVGRAGAATLAEITHLWWFADGAIMDVGTRAHLHRSWGLCRRHAWLYLRVEIELRVSPLGNAVLVADLINRAAELAAGRHSLRHRRAAATVRVGCFTCVYAARSAGIERFRSAMHDVNAGARTRTWAKASEHVWRRVACPGCVPDADASPGIACRAHVDWATQTAAQAHYLNALAERVRRCQKSLTADGPERSADSDAALLEGIGWCAGWSPELATRRLR